MNEDMNAEVRKSSDTTSLRVEIVPTWWSRMVLWLITLMILSIVMLGYIQWDIGTQIRKIKEEHNEQQRR